MLSVSDMQSANSETCTSVIKEPPCVKTQKHDEMQYLDLIQYILDNGTKKEDRTGRMEILILYLKSMWEGGMVVMLSL